jgi:hypothetical protein
VGWTDACSRQEDIIDEYKVYQQAPQVDGENVLMCKLGCEKDPLIANVKTIEWDDKAMFIKNSQGSINMRAISSCMNEVIG